MRYRGRGRPERRQARSDQEIQAALLKRYGSVVDVSAADAPGIDDGTTSFGLFNPSADGDPIALFDGATLTVTATFEDGSSSTQVITLHEAMFRVEPRYTDNPTYFAMTSEITSRDVDPTATETRGGTPPLDRTKSEFAYQRSFMGDSAYADKWLERRFGMSFNDDGTIVTDGVTFATITIDIENMGNADEDFVANASSLASLVVVEDDGSVSDISRTSYELVNEVDAPSRADDYEGTIYTAPANSHVTCVFAYTVPSHFATDGNVYVMVNGKLFPVGA